MGCQDVAAARQLVPCVKADRTLGSISVRLRDIADELGRTIRTRGGEVPSAGNAERRTCTIILQKLRARFGDRTIFGELEGYCGLLVSAIDETLATVHDAVWFSSTAISR